MDVCLASNQTRKQEALKLHRFFSTFPEGLPGLGLLILRLTVAGTIQFLTLSFYYDLITSTFRGWLVGVVSILFSASMFAGLLTPVISALIFICGIAFLILSPREVVIYLVILSFVIILLGPGAYSVDARLFGWREIIVSKEKFGDKSS